MTREDFSNGFDTLLSSYANTAAFGNDTSIKDLRIDEYEKSLFLTKAQEDVVLSLYTGRNSSAFGFEETEELRRYLSSLIKEKELTAITNSSGNPIGIDGQKNTRFFTLPSDLWFITYESVQLGDDAPCGSGSSIEVVPVRQDEYHKLRKNPFRGANNRRALRLDLGDNNVELISKFKISKYYIRYLHKLTPIVLIDLANDNLDIQGEKGPKDCEVHESLHQRILERAVQMALQSKNLVARNITENK